MWGGGKVPFQLACERGKKEKWGKNLKKKTDLSYKERVLGKRERNGGITCRGQGKEDSTTL